MRVERHAFARLLADTAKVVEARNTIPILTTVRLVAADNRLAVTATDLDIEVSGSIDAETGLGGAGDIAVCIDAKLLTGIVNKVAGGEVSIDADADGGVVLRAGKSRFKLETLPVDDFPDMPAGDLPAAFNINLAALVAPVKFAMSDEEVRYYLNGVYLRPLDGNIVAVATDGHRMSVHSAPLADEFPAVIVPAKTVGLIPSGDIRVELSSTKIRLTSGDVVITSKLIDGTFPDYERVIPRNNDKIIAVDAGTLRAAANRVVLISNERGRSVKLSAANDSIDLTARGAGEASDSVACEYSNDPVEVGLNAQYLSDVLTAMPDGQVRIALADAGSPVLFTSPANDNLRVVAMPMRVG
jgi:DNA polymerase-3 subunit beta